MIYTNTWRSAMFLMKMVPLKERKGKQEKIVETHENGNVTTRTCEKWKQKNKTIKNQYHKENL